MRVSDWTPEELSQIKDVWKRVLLNDIKNSIDRMIEQCIDQLSTHEFDLTSTLTVTFDSETTAGTLLAIKERMFGSRGLNENSD